MTDPKLNLDGSHAGMVAKHFKFVSTTNFKQLKGVDRENLGKLQGMVKQCAEAMVFSCIDTALIPYLSDFTKSLIEKTACGSLGPFLQEGSCLAQLPPAVLGSGSGNPIEALRAFSVFMRELVCTTSSILANKQYLEATAAQDWIMKWEQHSLSLLKAIKAFSQPQESIQDKTPDEVPEEAVVYSRVMLACMTSA